MRGSYTGYMARNSAWLAEQDAKTTQDVYDMVQTLLQQGVLVTYQTVQVTGVEYLFGTRELIVRSNKAEFVVQRESMGFYELQSQARRLLQEGDSDESESEHLL